MAFYFENGDRVHLERRAAHTAHAELFSAFEYGEILTYDLYLPSDLRPSLPLLSVLRDEDGERILIPGFYHKDHLLFTVHTDEICRRDLRRGLFYLSFILDDLVLTPGGRGSELFIGREEDAHALFQLSVYEPGTNRPTGYEGGIMYQIFPDRFSKSGKDFRKEGAVMESDWYARVSEFSPYPGAPVNNDHFFGGDLCGIAEKLDYLQSLGVTLLYLNPIFRAASNHRYDTGDYEQVDELLGGDGALEYLLEKTQEKGIGVILDGVFNHTGSDSRYFNKYGRYPETGAYQSKDSPYYPWYFFSEYPDRYESWWGIDILPKVNCSCPAYRDYITGRGGIIERYLEKGIAGWRLDVADELNDAMLDGIRSASDRVRRNALIYGEVWEDASNKTAYSVRRHYFTGGQLSAVMNYPLKNAIISFLVDGNAEFLFDTQQTLYAHYPKAVSDMQMNILSTHDTVRILNMLAGDPHGNLSASEMAQASLSPEERFRAKRLLRLATVIQMFMPGIPCIYYGDEIGMEGDRDPFNRQTYKWGREDREVLDFYRTITALRTSLPMLKDAYYRGLYAKGGVFVFERFNDRERVVVAVNRSTVPFKYGLYSDGEMLYPGKRPICCDIFVEPESAVVFRASN